jgi:hypothetical protein
MVLSFAFGAWASWPGDALGAVVPTGAIGELVGAGDGDDCASATPTDIKTAAEASRRERILVSFVDKIRAFKPEAELGAGGTCNKF